MRTLTGIFLILFLIGCENPTRNSTQNSESNTLDLQQEEQNQVVSEDLKCLIDEEDYLEDEDDSASTGASDHTFTVLQTIPFEFYIGDYEQVDEAILDLNLLQTSWDMEIIMDIEIETKVYAFIYDYHDFLDYEDTENSILFNHSDLTGGVKQKEMYDFTDEINYLISEGHQYLRFNLMIKNGDTSDDNTDLYQVELHVNKNNSALKVIGEKK